MKVTTERLENCIVALDIEVDDKETHNYFRDSARTLARQYRIPGFRPGKAPYNIIVQRFGVDAIRSQVLDQFGDKVFEEGLKESKLEPVDQASLDDVTWDPFTLHVKVPVAPDIDLGDYRTIRIDWQNPEVTDEQVDGELQRLQKEHSEWEDTERPAELGDQIVIDITGKIDDKVVLGNTAREMVLNADSPYPVPGFAEQVVGMKPGEKREFDLTYPEDHYNPDTAGKEAHFEATLHKIKIENLPELDDEFAVLVGDYENLEDLKVKLGESLQTKAENQANEEYMETIWEKLLETATVDYPEVYVDREVEMVKQQLEGQLKQNGMDLESYFKLTNTTEEEWKTTITPQATERLKRRLVLDKIIQEEKLKLEEGELDQEVERIVEPMGEQAESMREWLTSPMGASAVIESLLTDKATERLRAIAKGQAPSLEELEAEQETQAGQDAGEQVTVTEAAEAVKETSEEKQAVQEPTETESSVEAESVEEKTEPSDEEAEPQEPETHDVAQKAKQELVQEPEDTSEE